MPILGGYNIEVDSTNPGTSNTITFDVPSGTVEGNVLVVGITTAPGVTVNTPSGWNALSTVNGGTGSKFHTFYRSAPSSVPSQYSFTRVGSGDTWCGQLVRIDGAEAFDVSASSSGTADQSLQAGLLNSPVTGDIMIAFWGCRPTNSGTPTLTPAGGSWTSLGTVTSSNSYGYPAVTGSSAKVTGTDQPSATTNKNVEWASVTVAFKAEGAPPEDPTGTGGTYDVTGSTSSSVTWPNGTSIGDMGVLFVGVKPYTATINTPTGWTKVDETTNGTTGSGLDTGSVKVAAFQKICSSTSASVSVTATGSNCIVTSLCSFTKDFGKIWMVEQSTVGSDTTNGANYSATGGAPTEYTLSGTLKDILVVGSAINSDGGTRSGHALTTSGITFGTLNVRVNQGSTVGDDMAIVAVDATATAGSSTSAPVYTFTNASSSSGSSIFIRLRSIAPAVSAAFNNSVNSPGFDITTSVESGFATFGLDTYTVSREDLSGQYDTEAVRGMDRVIPNYTTATDYEYPFVDEIRYIYDAYEIDGVKFAQVTSTNVVPTFVASPSLLTGNFYIKDVTTPNRSIAAVVSTMEVIENPGNILGEYHVLGRREPVIFTDIVSARTGSFTVTSTDFIGTTGISSTLAHRNLFKTGEVLLFQSVKNTVDFPDMYFVVERFSEDFITRPDGTVMTVIFSVSFKEVNRPLTLDIAVSSATWGDLYNDPAYSTWADVAANNATWSDVLARYS